MTAAWFMIALIAVQPQPTLEFSIGHLDGAMLECRERIYVAPLNAAVFGGREPRDPGRFDPSSITTLAPIVNLRELQRLAQEFGAVSRVDDLGRDALIVVAGSPQLSRMHDDRSARINILLANGASADHRDSEGRTALMYAAKIGNLDAMRALRRAGSDIGAQDRMGYTPLLHAATAESPSAVLQLLEWGADLHAVDVCGREAVAIACRNPSSSLSTIATLIELGCDVRRRDRLGLTALHYALAMERSPQIIASLSLAGASAVDVGLSEASLAVAMGQGGAFKIDGVRSSADRLDAFGRHPLIWAAIYGDAPFIEKALRSEGSIVNVPDSVGWTALHHAAARGNRRAVDQLLGGGAEPSIRDSMGRTPAMYAVISGLGMSAISDADGFWSVRDRDGMNAIDLSLKFGTLGTVVDVWRRLTPEQEKQQLPKSRKLIEERAPGWDRDRIVEFLEERSRSGA